MVIERAVETCLGYNHAVSAQMVGIRLYNAFCNPKNIQSTAQSQRRSLVLTRTLIRNEMNSALHELSPPRDIDIFSDTNSSLMQCPALLGHFA